MTLPLLSSSKYQSCIESPTPTESYRNVIFQDNYAINSRMSKKRGDCENSVSAGTSPLSEVAPGLDQLVVDRMSDEGKNRSAFLSDINLICQQKSKPLSYMISEIMEYCKNFDQIQI